MIYEVLSEHANERQKRELDNELKAHPARSYSRGAGDLMAMMGGGRRPA